MPKARAGAFFLALGSLAVLAAYRSVALVSGVPMSCDDGLKAAFKPAANTSMGGNAEVQKFLRLGLVPGKAHSSQGRSYTVSG